LGEKNVWQRVRVRYDNGLTVTANQSDQPLRVDNHVLGQYGWVAEGAGVTAWTARRGGVVADFAETSDSVFVNARSARDWDLSGTMRIRPAVDRFTINQPRHFRVTYTWRVDQTLPRNYTCFVHFGKEGKPESEILFQQDHTPALPTSRWRPGTILTDGPYEISVPDRLPDGDYSWTIGLHRPTEGRLILEGVTDGSGRIRLGTLRLSEQGGKLSFVPERESIDSRKALYLENVNRDGTVIDFGSVRTDGSVLCEREGSEWVARTFPRDRAFALLLSSIRFGQPSEIRSPGGRSRSTNAIPEGSFWKLPLNGAGEYRWAAQVTPGSLPHR
jgi:hypothetical protein